MLASMIIVLIVIMFFMIFQSVLFIRNDRSHILQGYIIAIMAGLGATFSLDVLYAGGRAGFNDNTPTVFLTLILCLISGYAFTSAWESRNIRVGADA